jgi:hypothetical protein
MKLLLSIFALALMSQTAFAHPGSHSFVCKSVNNSGLNQKLEVHIKRMNGVGWIHPTIEMTLNDQLHTFTTPSDESNYGETFHNSPLGVITSSVEVPYEEATVNGHFRIVAMPKTVKAFDYEGNPVEWKLEDEQGEEGECYDSNGSAKFQAIINGYFNFQKSEFIKIETQILDCELTYNSGMSC